MGGVRARRVLLPHANHWIFSDYAYLVPQLQAAGLVTAGARAALVGPGDPAAATAVVRRGVRSFFDRRLPAAPAGTSAADSPRRVSQ
ncbi:acetylhydrolase [Streptomyces tanashiensis]